MNLPILRGSIAVHPNGKIRVHRGVELLERLLLLSLKRGERLFRNAARQGARFARGETGGDATGQSDGGDERDDGFVAEHVKEWSVRAVVVFKALSVK